MAKNYADIYNSGNVSIGLEQRLYLKQETTRGELIAPAGTDFLFTLAGGGVENAQEYISSPHRTGRHHTNVIYQKKTCSWSLSTYFNINEALGAPGVAEIDPAVRLLWKSLMGNETTVAGPKYTPTTPSVTFTILECGDMWAKQCRGAFVQTNTATFPGDGEATCAWAGDAKDAIHVGMGKSTTDNNAGNTVTLVTGDGAQFKKSAGGMVMLIEANGTTRSADTPDGTPRKIVSVVGDVVTLDGAVLADADGSGVGAPVYLVYYEPATPTAIDNPVTGLVGSFSIDGLTDPLCVRSVTLTFGNEHELVNYCYGADSASGKIFVPGNRFSAMVSFEANIDKTIYGFFQSLQNFEAQVVELILGSAAGRHLDIDIPKAKFKIPSIPVPETGSVPVTFEGDCLQTAIDAGDEVTVEFK